MLNLDVRCKITRNRRLRWTCVASPVRSLLYFFRACDRSGSDIVIEITVLVQDTMENDQASQTFATKSPLVVEDLKVIENVASGILNNLALFVCVKSRIGFSAKQPSTMRTNVSKSQTGLLSSVTQDQINWTLRDAGLDLRLCHPSETVV